ncbi:vacuolar atpase v1 domain subunit g [Brettanomyces bruxellensis AWRI1499]|nr:vacuolar atpase v1 domain subunit g [Brettanomyces bruxellensis AWRI1499]
MSGGIQSLLKTEKDAQQIVAQARKCKQQKKDAKAEIDSYKSSKSDELKKFEDEFVGANKKAEQDAEKQVQGELESIRKTAASKKDAVVKLLTEAVSTPNPELPRNIKKVEA